MRSVLPHGAFVKQTICRFLHATGSIFAALKRAPSLASACSWVWCALAHWLAEELQEPLFGITEENLNWKVKLIVVDWSATVTHLEIYFIILRRPPECCANLGLKSWRPINKSKRKCSSLYIKKSRLFCNSNFRLVFKEDHAEEIGVKTAGICASNYRIDMYCACRPTY